MNASVRADALSEPDDTFEIEVADLRRARGPAEAFRAWPARWRALSPPAPASPLAPRLTPERRVWRLIAGTLLVLLVVPGLFPALGARVWGAFAPSGMAGVGNGLGAAPASPLAPLLRDARWGALEQRPLALASLAPGTACPTTPGHIFAAGVDAGLGSGPVYAVAPGSETGALDLQPPRALGARGQGWAGQKVVWFVDAAYQGPVLIRGRRLDGPGLIRFNGGLDQVAEIANLPGAPLLAALRLEGDSSLNAPWPGWPGYTRVRAPGCYAYQADGVNFSEVIVFQAEGVAVGAG